VGYTADSSHRFATDAPVQDALVLRPRSARIFASCGGLLCVLFAAVFVIGSVPTSWRGPCGWITFVVSVGALLRGRRVSFRADDRGIEIKNFLRTVRADWSEVSLIDTAKLLRATFRVGYTPTADPIALRFTIRARHLRIPAAVTAYMGEKAGRVIDQLRVFAESHGVPMEVTADDYQRLGYGS
jgi:hypothetical protein